MCASVKLHYVCKQGMNNDCFNDHNYDMKSRLSTLFELNRTTCDEMIRVFCYYFIVY